MIQARLATAFALSVSSLALSTVAWGQAAEPAEDAAAPAAKPVPSAGDIVVTGSRIVRAGFSAPTPVTVLNTDTLSQKAPTSLPDALNQLPVFQNSINQNTGDSVQPNRVRSGNYLNLRALGPNRLLVLQDGRRVPPTSNNGGVDTNLIPQMLIQRVDIVTGGASAAYGSDAVSGVVNFVIDKKFSGFKAQLQKGISRFGDNGNYRAAFAAGQSFLDDRLHVLVSADHFHSDGIDNRFSRDKFGSIYASFGGDGTAAKPFRFYDNVHYSTVTFGGYIHNGPLAGQQFVNGGTTTSFNPGADILRTGLANNGDGADFAPMSTFIPTLTTDQFYGRVSYEVSDNISIFADASYNTALNTDKNNLFFRFNNMTIFRENAFLAPSTVTALGSTPSFTMSEIFSSLGTLDSSQRTKALNTTLAIEGKLGGNWKWDLSYIHGDAKFRNNTGDVSLRKFYAALDAVRDTSGNIVCGVSITNPGIMPGCVPINPFGTGGPSAAANAYIRENTVWGTQNKLDSVAANISGDLVNLWAGPMSVALGGEYRKQSLVQYSNNDPAVVPDFTGIRGVPAGTLAYNLLNIGQAKGSYTIKEAYLESSLPLLKDSALGQSAEINGAVRWTDYSTSGTVYTWKLGGTYQPIPDIRFRATVSRDIRAPSLFELYAGQTINFTPFSDPLTNTFGQIPNKSGGNPLLTPEIGKTFTGGVVLNPRFLPGLSISVDYFNIKLKDAISAPFNASQAIIQCTRSGGTDPLCALVTRPLGFTDTSPANFPTGINVTSQNVSTLSTRGIDMEVSYRSNLGGGQIGARALGTKLISFKRQTYQGQPILEYAGTSDLPGFNSTVPLPKWRANFELTYTIGGLTIGAQERVIGGYDRSHQLIYVDNTMPAVAYTDANITYKIPTTYGTYELFGTVNNLFNTAPPYWPITSTPGLQLPTQRTTYDVIGTYFTVGVKVKI